MAREGEDAILKDVLAAWERGEDPDLATLQARHPGLEHAAERMHGAAAAYRRMVKTLQADGTDELLPPGARLGDFEVEEPLARGGMGVVYRARQLSLGGRSVALKVLPDRLENAGSRTRFRREAALLSKLHHPSLAEVYGFGEETERVFFAMRLVTGPTLLAWMEERRSSTTGDGARAERRLLVAWIADVAAALAVVHTAGLVHRDVKASNIVLEEPTDAEWTGPRRPRAVLVDFGLVRPVVGGLDTLTGRPGITESYAPPEQLLGRAVDPRADVFALGVTLHDLLADRFPNERPQASAGLEPLDELMPDVEPDLAAIVSRSVDPDARWRYPNAGELLADLTAWLEGQPVSARRPPMFERLERWIRANPWRLARGGASFVAVAGVALLVAFLGRWSDYAARARAAFERGAPLAFVEAAERLPSVLSRPLLGRVLAPFAARARALAPEDPLTRMAECLRVDDREGALVAAATHMRVAGIADDRLVGAYFVTALRGEPAGSADAFRSLRGVALALTARLFYERPDESADDVAASASLRAALLELWEGPELLRDEQLYVLSALSGCGTADEAAWILEWSIGQQPFLEEQRLGLRSAARILRRVRSCGELERLDFERLSRAFLGLSATMYELACQPTAPDETDHYGVRAAIAQVAEALAFAERASGRAPTPGQTLPAAWIRHIASGTTDEVGLAPRILAACADPRIVPRLRNGVLLGAEYGGPAAWGWLCGAYGDPSLTSAARGLCAELASASDAGEGAPEQFDAGARRGADILRGVPPVSDLDADTLLGAPVTDSGRSRLELNRGTESPGRAASLSGVWNFMTLPATASGIASGAELYSADLTRVGEPHPYLRLWRFGASEVVLEFETPGDPGRSSWVLELEHLPAMRPYFPRNGEVRIDVIVDGVALVRSLLIDEGVDTLAVPSALLTSGPSRITVRSHRLTNTTYRLYRVTLFQRR